jgi:glyceraldehyde-3-phosphate dehydrogenase (EC 1.2.1.12)
VDAIRASTRLMSAEDSIRITNESLGILKGYLI